MFESQVKVWFFTENVFWIFFDECSVTMKILVLHPVLDSVVFVSVCQIKFRFFSGEITLKCMSPFQQHLVRVQVYLYLRLIISVLCKADIRI